MLLLACQQREAEKLREEVHVKEEIKLMRDFFKKNVTESNVASSLGRERYSININSLNIPNDWKLTVLSVTFHGNVKNPIGILIGTNHGSFYCLEGKESDAAMFLQKYKTKKVEEGIYELSRF